MKRAEEKTAFIVFCEGPHDVAFMRQVLEKKLNFKRVEWRFSEFPAPFNSLFKANVQKHAAKDLSLDMAHKFFLPDRVLIRDDANLIAMLFNTGGATQIDKVKKFLIDFLTLFPEAKYNPMGTHELVSQVRYLFLYDADEHGVEKRRQETKKNFAIIKRPETNDEIHWLKKEWIVNTNDKFGAVAGEIAIYIWGSSTEKGTLEDILMPILEQSHKERAEQASAAIESMFTWETEDSKAKKAVAELAKKHKAIITLAGQREKPGSSLNVIIGQSKEVFDKSIFLKNERILVFSKFIASFLEISDSAE